MELFCLVAATEVTPCDFHMTFLNAKSMMNGEANTLMGMRP
jgi:hypothetical protein